MEFSDPPPFSRADQKSIIESTTSNDTSTISVIFPPQGSSVTDVQVVNVLAEKLNMPPGSRLESLALLPQLH